MGRLGLAAAAALLAAIAVLGAWAALTRYTPAYTWEERSILPWGFMVPSYAYFASSAAGLAMVAGAAMIAERPEGLASRYHKHLLWASLSLLVPAWIIVFEDIGRPDHALWLLAGWQPLSRIAWMPVFYALLAIPLLALLALAIRRQALGTLGKLLAGVIVAAAVGLELNLGMLFSTAVSVPAWHCWLEFLLASIALGAAWGLVLLPLLSRREQQPPSPGDTRVLGAVLASVTLLYGACIALSAAGSAANPFMKAFFAETMADPLFWILEVGLGIAVAGVLGLLVAYKPSTSLGVAAGLAAAIGGFYAKYGFTIHGQLARLDPHAYGLALISPYSLLGEAHAVQPVTPQEALGVLGAFAAGLLVLLLGEALLALGSQEKPTKLLFLR